MWLWSKAQTFHTHTDFTAISKIYLVDTVKGQTAHVNIYMYQCIVVFLTINLKNTHIYSGFYNWTLIKHLYRPTSTNISSDLVSYLNDHIKCTYRDSFTQWTLKKKLECVTIKIMKVLLWWVQERFNRKPTAEKSRLNMTNHICPDWRRWKSTDFQMCHTPTHPRSQLFL